MSPFARPFNFKRSIEAVIFLSFDLLCHFSRSHTYGSIKEPETDISGEQVVHLFWTHIPSEVILPDGENEASHTYVTSISPSRADALFGYHEAITSDSSALLNTHEQVKFIIISVKK